MRLAGAVFFAALLVGCGSMSESSLDRAADATEAETSRFEMSYRISGDNPDLEEFSFDVSGLFDYPNERGLMTVEGGGSPEQGLPAEVRVIGKSGYMRWVRDGKSYWVKEEEPVQRIDDPAELLVPVPGGDTRPTDVFTRVLLASEDTDKLGREEVRGVDAAHYRAQVDGRKLLDQLPKDRRQDPEDVWGDRFIPVEIWIDDESRLRRLELTQNLGEGDPVTMMMTIELFDYGVAVNVEPPPTGELISQEQLDKLGEGEIPPVSGKGEPVSPDEICESARNELPKKKADRFCLELKENE